MGFLLCLMTKDCGLFCYLGQQFQGKHIEKATLTLAFLFDKPVDILALTNRVIRLLHTDNVDVVDLKRASPLLKFSVVKNGMLLYEREQACSMNFIHLPSGCMLTPENCAMHKLRQFSNFLKARGL